MLKMYDRRFAFGMRECEKMSPWDDDIEAQYCDLAVREGRASKFFDTCEEKCRKNLCWADEVYESWSKAEEEAYSQYLCNRIYNTEREAYSILESLQGKHIPRIFGEVYREHDISKDSKAQQDCRHNHPGLILEYIQGFPLIDLANNAPKSSWQVICDQAISVVHSIGKNGVCNEDLQIRNFIIRQNHDNAGYTVFLVDFGDCTFRNDVKDLDEFRERQAHQDEEGVVGRVMQSKLGDGFKYEFSAYALKLMDDFMSEI